MGKKRNGGNGGKEENMKATFQNKVADLGVYLCGRRENVNCGWRMVFAPESCGRGWLRVCSVSLRDRNARRMAARIADEMACAGQ